MVVNETGLMRAMKEAYKSAGYCVAAENTGDMENIILCTNTWAAIIEKKNMPRKALGLIAEHVGEIPQPGQAYQVRKGDPQTEIYDVVNQTIRAIHAGDKPLRIVKRTQLTMGCYQLWQRKDDLRIFQVNPALEEILMLSRGTVRIVGDDTLMLDDLESRAYIAVEKVADQEKAAFEHLSQMQWVVM